MHKRNKTQRAFAFLLVVGILFTFLGVPGVHIQAEEPPPSNPGPMFKYASGPMISGPGKKEYYVDQISITGPQWGWIKYQPRYVPGMTLPQGSTHGGYYGYRPHDGSNYKGWFMCAELGVKAWWAGIGWGDYSYASIYYYMGDINTPAHQLAGKWISYLNAINYDSAYMAQLGVWVALGQLGMNQGTELYRLWTNFKHELDTNPDSDLFRFRVDWHEFFDGTSLTHAGREDGGQKMLSFTIAEEAPPIPPGGLRVKKIAG